MKRLLDFLAYIAIALAIGFAIIWYAHYGDPHGGEKLAKWGGLAGNTALLYGAAVKAYGAAWRNWRFWAALLALLDAHLTVFVLVLTHVEHWKAVWFLPMYLIEAPLLIAACERVRGDKRFAR